MRLHSVCMPSKHSRFESCKNSDTFLYQNIILFFSFFLMNYNHYQEDFCLCGSCLFKILERTKSDIHFSQLVPVYMFSKNNSKNMIEKQIKFFLVKIVVLVLLYKIVNGFECSWPKVSKLCYIIFINNKLYRYEISNGLMKSFIISVRMIWSVYNTSAVNLLRNQLVRISIHLNDCSGVAYKHVLTE